MKRNERGWALTAAIVFVTILSLFGGTLWQAIVTESRHSSILCERAAAEALADAGIAWALAEIRRAGAVPAERMFPLGEGLVRVAIRRENAGVRIEATGEVGRSTARRTLDVEVDR